MMTCFVIVYKKNFGLCHYKKIQYLREKYKRKQRTQYVIYYLYIFIDLLFI